MPDDDVAENEMSYKDWDYETIHTVFCRRCQWEAQFSAPYWSVADVAMDVYAKHWKETHGAIQ